MQIWILRTATRAVRLIFMLTPFMACLPRAFEADWGDRQVRRRAQTQKGSMAGVSYSGIAVLGCWW